MTFKQLKYFLTIYEHQNMTKAAEALFVSRPVLSRALVEFESELGFTLFYRTSAGVVPTEKGMEFYRTVSAISNLFEGTLKNLRGNDNSDNKSELKIGLLDSCGSWLYTSVIVPFCDSNPDIRVIIKSGLEENRERLLSGEIDCLITTLPSETPIPFDWDYLYSVHNVFCSKASDSRNQVSLQELEDIPLAELKMLPQSGYIHNNIVMSTNQLELIHKAVADGRVCAVLPSDLVIDWKDVACLPIEPSISSDVFFLSNKAKKKSEALQKFRSYVTSFNYSMLLIGPAFQF